MIVILQCAGTKRKDKRTFVLRDGRTVSFVANPTAAPPDPRSAYAHPDGRAVDGRTWRQLVDDVNRDMNGSSQLHRAYELYEPPASPLVYRRLVEAPGVGKVYILSAGWGLVRSDYRLPDYDITFAPEAARKASWKLRGPRDASFQDYIQLPSGGSDALAFVGSQAYLPQFLRLTRAYGGPRTVFYNSSNPVQAPGCVIERFESANRRTWQYECALMLAGK